MNLVYYLIEVSIGLALFYSLYALFLKKETFFSINRYYLLGTIVLSLLIPIPDVSLTSQIVDNPDNFEFFEETLGEFSVNVKQIEKEVHTKISLTDAISWIYLLGVISFMVVFFIHLSRLVKLIRKHKIIKRNGLKFVLLDQKNLPFSFLNYVFINESNFTTTDFEKIMIHENVHAKQRHSIDLIVLEILSILLWFNPFIYWYKKSIKEVHEYLADEGVLRNGFDKPGYFNLLLQEVQKQQLLCVTSNFYSLTKKRLKMMTKIKSKTIAKCKVLLGIPIFAVLIMLFAFSFDTGSSGIPLLPVLTNPDTENVPSICPIEEGKYRISSGFGMRIHPIYKIEKMHYAIDLVSKKGTPVMATADGTVIKKEFKEQGKGYGRYIDIKHNETYSTRYAQLSEFKVEVEQKIKKGDVIGLVGSSGISTAPHLHYEVHKNGERVDPADYFGNTE